MFTLFKLIKVNRLNRINKINHLFLEMREVSSQCKNDWVLLGDELVGGIGAQNFPRHHPLYIDTVLHEDVTAKPIIIAITTVYANVKNVR